MKLFDIALIKACFFWINEKSHLIFKDIDCNASMDTLFKEDWKIFSLKYITGKVNFLLNKNWNNKSSHNGKMTVALKGVILILIILNTLIKQT